MLPPPDHTAVDIPPGDVPPVTTLRVKPGGTFVPAHAAAPLSLPPPANHRQLCCKGDNDANCDRDRPSACIRRVPLSFLSAGGRRRRRRERPALPFVRHPLTKRSGKLPEAESRTRIRPQTPVTALPAARLGGEGEISRGVLHVHAQITGEGKENRTGRGRSRKAVTQTSREAKSPSRLHLQN